MATTVELINKRNISRITNMVHPGDACNLQEVYEEIKSDKHKVIVEAARQLATSGNKDGFDSLKKMLPGWTISGVCKDRRSEANIWGYSGYIGLDIDRLRKEQIAELKEKCRRDRYAFLVYETVSGEGLRIVIATDASKEDHKQVYMLAIQYYEQMLGVKLDPSTNDVARLFFASWDPNAIFNQQAEVFVYKPVVALEKQVCTNSSDHEAVDEEESFNKDFEYAIKYAGKKGEFTVGGRNKFVLLVAFNCNRYGLDQNLVLKACIERFEQSDFPKAEIISIVQRVYETKSEDFGSWVPYSRKLVNGVQVQDVLGESEAEIEKMPHFPQQAIESLPKIFQLFIARFKNPMERDFFVASVLVTLGSAMTNVKAVYDGCVVYPSLYFLGLAPAGNYKSAVKISRSLLSEVDKKVRLQSLEAHRRYEQDLRKYESLSPDKQCAADKPVEPPFQSLFVAGNITTAALYQRISSNATSCIHETETDTVGEATAGEHGRGTSALFRQAFHHETVIKELKNGIRFEIEQPKLSIVLTGTLGTLEGIIKSREDGLYSRFFTLNFPGTAEWRDVSPRSGKGLLPQLVSQTAKDIVKMVDAINAINVNFDLKEEQWDQLNERFGNNLNELNCFYGDDIAPVVKRSGLMCVRMAMILSVIAAYERGNLSESLTCDDNEFQTAMLLIDVHLKHSASLLKSFSKEKTMDSGKRRFYEALPMQFERKEALEIWKKLGISKHIKTFDNWLADFVTRGLLARSDGFYKKTNVIPLASTASSNQVA